MERILESMSSRLKAVVSGGQAIIKDVGDYPDGTVLELAIVEDDEMDESERERLHAALRKSMAQARAGQTRPAEEVLDRLFAKT